MITLTGGYLCHWEPLIDSDDASDELPEPLPGEGLCPPCLARMYEEVLHEDDDTHG